MGVASLHRNSSMQWKLVKKCNFKVKDKWYKQEPEKVLENEDYKVQWDFNIQSDHAIKAKRHEFVVVDKKNGTCKIINCALHRDSRIGD